MATATLGAGDTIARFRIEGKLGAGGMGEVYRARDTRLGRTVAIKVLRREFAEDGPRRERFEQEARAASALSHANIVTVFDAAIDGGVPWIAMELVEGRSLREALREGPLAPERLLDIAVPIADALAKAHEAGIVHRDLKPENVMIAADGAPKILDFGLAKLTAPSTGDDAETVAMTTPGVVMGTLDYMAPEQLLGRAADHRSDQFSLGAMLYEMATGASPFKRETGPQTIAAVLESKPRLEGGPAGLACVVNRCLEKDAADRFASTRQLADALEAEKARRGGGPAQRIVRSRRPRWLLAAALTVTAAAAAWVGLRGRPSSGAPAVVAVRTFKNLSRQPMMQEYVANGVSEEIRARLSKVSSIRVAGRRDVDQWAASDVRAVAKAVGAASVVEGTVSADKERVRLSVQVTDPATMGIMWRESYDRPTGEIPRLESEMALRIADAVHAPLTAEERQRIDARQSESAAAYDLYLQALTFTRRSRDSTARAISLLKQAVEFDPVFVDAMAEIAYDLVYIPDPRTVPEAREWAEKAASINPQSAAAQRALALAYSAMGMLTKAQVSFQRAIALEPNTASTMDNYSEMLLHLGKYEESLHWSRTALDKDPSHYSAYYHISEPLLRLATAAEFERWMDIWKAHFPNYYRWDLMRARVDLRQGRAAKALDDVRALARRRKGVAEVENMLADLAMIQGAPDAEESFAEFSKGALDPAYDTWWLLPESGRARMAWFRLNAGDRGESGRLLEDAERVATQKWRDGVETPALAVELAAIRSMRADTDGAMEWLRKAYERGWRDVDSTAVDPMLAGVRRHPAFDELRRRMESDVRQMAERSTEVKLLFETTVPRLPAGAPPRPPN